LEKWVFRRGGIVEVWAAVGLRSSFGVAFGSKRGGGNLGRGVTLRRVDLFVLAREKGYFRV
jgi:hypothetical protein